MKKRISALLLALLLLCAGCAQGDGGSREGEYSVYFPTHQGREDGAALDSETRALPAGRGAVDGLLRLLLSGPESPELASPFPRGTTLRGWRVEEGVAFVDLSEAYGGLSGVDLSLADGCIVLTLCQLESVEAVYLTVEGRPRPFRDQMLRASDLMLDNGEGGPSELEAELWFPSGQVLSRESRTLRLEVGDDRLVAALQALLTGPETAGLSPVCPEGTRLLSLEREKGRLVVDLSEEWMKGEQTAQRLYAVVDTLAALEPGVQVSFRVEGQDLEQFGETDLSLPLTADPVPDPSQSP